MSKEDWDFAESNSGQRDRIPKCDGVIGDGQKITLGDTTLTAYFTPGHTPGALSVIVPVRVGRTVHHAAWWGGPQWGLRNTEMRAREQMDKSMTYFKKVATDEKADVFLETHPFMSGLIVRMAMVRNRKPGQPHPMVVGTDGIQRYLTVWQECGRAAEARYRVQELLYGPDRQKWPPRISVPVHVR
jgi:metallo-beta-lactamase class B